MSFLPMPAQSRAEIIPTLSLILVLAIKLLEGVGGWGKRWNTLNKKEHLNWSGYLYSDMCIPHHFLIQSDATLPQS